MIYVLILSAVLLTACGSEPRTVNKERSDNLPSTSANGSSGLIGAWVAACTFENDQNEAAIVSYDFSDPSFAMTVEVFSDQGCAARKSKTRITGSYLVGGQASGVVATNIDMTFEKSFITLYTEKDVSGFNTARAFNVSDWAVGQEREITSSGIFGGKGHNIFKISGNQLFFGKDSGEATTLDDKFLVKQ
jgi:hypothetical protein